MPGIFSEDLKRRVREANNLVDVVQAAVGKLTRAGRNLKACCPFHNEKTPSFNVNADGQYFKCFGCGKSGDVFTFVMLHERVEFPEAFQMLADRAGIRVEVDPQAAVVHQKEKDWKSYLYKINDVAAKFFREQLFSDAGKAAREYIKKRGLSDEICEQFRIGYAPSGGSPLLERLRSMKAPVKAIVEAGLATQRDDGSVRDFFYDRLMFPITNIEGKVIAFGGRILGLGEPKYLNTRETLLFSKTKTVYGIDHAKSAIVDSRKAILVEGYTDVMMCHQFGVTNVVACLGTAITSDHIRVLRRVADELLLMTDSDAAGAKASERSIAV
ncbi:MAG TPA: DNA primase, partial [Planctomycetota bacterium]|nr:DNA primase [Planctomycetota bacterium]